MGFIGLFGVFVGVGVFIGWKFHWNAHHSPGSVHVEHHVSIHDALNELMKLNANRSYLNTVSPDSAKTLSRLCRNECCFDPSVISDGRVLIVCDANKAIAGPLNLDLEDLLLLHCRSHWNYSPSCDKLNERIGFVICDVPNLFIAQYKKMPCSNSKSKISKCGLKPTCPKFIDSLNF